MKIEEIFGSWALVSFSNFSDDDNEIPWREFLSGRLIYAPTGIVSVAINRREKPIAGKAVERNSFYSGTFRLVNSETIEHCVEQSSDSKRVGDKYLRNFRLEANTLALEGDGLTGKVRLVWRRDYLV